MRWPAEWRDAAALDLLKDTPLGYLLLPSADGYQAVIQRARQLDLAICDVKNPPPGVAVEKGEWPGVRMTHGQGDATSGPTGAAWIDSNGWLIRLVRMRESAATVWVTSDPPPGNEIVPLSRHLLALADSAAHGGCWILTLDRDMAAGLAARKPASLAGWKKLMDAIAFFQVHREWSSWPVAAVLSVVSSFSGDNEFFSHELLNLMARTSVSYGIIRTESFRPESLASLRAVVYPDAQPPAPEVRHALLDFVERGGLLITGPKFGEAPGSPSAENSPVRYEMRRFGKGRIAMARKQPEDPYEVAQDAQILLSHRYDLVRFFNGFLFGAYATVSPDGKRRMAHILNYGGEEDAENPATARIAGRFRSARLWSFERGPAQTLAMLAQKEAVEVHLPGLAVYGGVELEA